MVTECDTGMSGGRGDHRHSFREGERIMKPKKIARVLISLALAGGVTLAGGTVANAAVYKCGPRCYTDDPTWKPGKVRSQY